MFASKHTSILIATITFAAALLAGQPAAHGALVEGTFTGTATASQGWSYRVSDDSYVLDNSDGLPVTGKAVSGSFSYETAGAVDQDPSSTVGRYAVSGSLTITVTDGNVYTSSGPLTITVRNDGSGDSLRFEDLDTPFYSPTGVNGEAVAFAIFDAATLSSDALPSTPLAPSLLAASSGYSDTGADRTIPTFGHTVDFDLSGLSLQPVPEPSGAMTVVAGASAWFMTGRRHRRDVARSKPAS